MAGAADARRPEQDAARPLEAPAVAARKIADAMGRKDRDAQDHFCREMTQLMNEFKETGADALIHADCFRLAVRSLGMFPDDRLVQGAALFAIRNLLRLGGPPAGRAAWDAGMARAVVVALRRAPKAIYIQRDGCEALAIFFAAGGAEAARAGVRAAATSSLVQSLRDNAGEAVVQEAACGALSRMLSTCDLVAVRSASEEGVAQAVCSTIHESSGAQGVTVPGFVALRCLAAFGEADVVKAAGAEQIAKQMRGLGIHGRAVRKEARLLLRELGEEGCESDSDGSVGGSFGVASILGSFGRAKLPGSTPGSFGAPGTRSAPGSFGKPEVRQRAASEGCLANFGGAAPHDEAVAELAIPGLIGGGLARVSEALNEDVRSSFPITMRSEGEGSVHSLAGAKKACARTEEAAKTCKGVIVGDTVDRDTGTRFYNIRVSRGSQEWSISRRYREFADLSKKLQGDAARLMPPKSFFRRRCSQQFLVRREQGLRDFLAHAILADPRLQAPVLRDFLAVPPEPAPTVISVGTKTQDPELAKNLAAMRSGRLPVPSPQDASAPAADEAVAELVEFEDAPQTASTEGAASAPPSL